MTTRLDPLYGIPAVFGTDEDFPVTHRNEYLGISREAVPPTIAPPSSWKVCRMCGQTKHVTIMKVDPLGWICNRCLEDIT